MAKKTIELEDGEEQILDGYANKISFWGGPSVKLVLTNQRLLFTKRPLFSYQRKTATQHSYDLRDIIFVEAARSATFWAIFMPILLFMENAIKITLKGGEEQRFVVHGKDRWIALIDENRKKLQGQEISQENS